MPLQIRRGTEAERTAMTQPLAIGELLYVTNTQRIYVGNGSTLGGIAVTGYTNEDAQDAVAPMFTHAGHSGISFAYNDASNIVTATLDLSNYQGTINASSFKGTLVADDSTPLIDAIDGKIFLDGTVKGNIVPDANEAYDIGSASFRFRDLYLSGSSIRLGNATITATGSAVNLPAGSTIGGEPLNASNLLTEISANIVADDSTIMVNTTTKAITAGGGFVGSLTGNVSGNINGVVTGLAGSSLVGNVTGNVLGNLSGNVTGDITGNSFGYHIGDVQGSVFAQDSTLMIDATSGDITAGLLTVTTRLDVSNILSDSLSGLVVSADGTTPLTISGIGTLLPSSGQVYLPINAAKGSLAAPTTTAAGDLLGGIIIQGYNGTTYKTASIIASAWEAGANLSDTYPKSKLQFGAFGGGSTIYVASFDSLGVFNAPVQKTTVYSVAGTALPSAASVGAGARAFVSDANASTFGTAYTGGGANAVPVYSDGSAWYIG